MKILALLSQRPHAHCYGGDYLLGALYATLGATNVYAWPEGETLHAGLRGACEICVHGYDSMQAWPRKGHTLEQAVRDADLCLIIAQPGDNTLRPLKGFLDGQRTYDGAGRRIHPRDYWPAENCLAHFRDNWDPDKPVVAVDMSDTVPGLDGAMHVNDLRAYYQRVAGERLTVALMFRRELPLRHYWAEPLPLSYPHSRVPRGQVTKYQRVFYWAAAHGDEPHSPGIDRRIIARSLAEHVPSVQREVHLITSGEERLRPDQYHAQMVGALVSVSWNGAVAYDNNRLWESFAYGCAVVAERPRITIPYAPEDGVHCVYVDTPEDVGPVVAELLKHPQETIAMAARGHQYFLRYHTSEARVRYMLEVIAARCGVRERREVGVSG